MRYRGDARMSGGGECVDAGGGLPIIDGAVRPRVLRVIAYARQNRVPLARLMAGTLGWGAYVSPGDDPHHVAHIPMGYRCVYSEDLQPRGLCRHLSVSVWGPGALPSDQAMRIIMGVFGFKSRTLESALSHYLEETPTAGVRAINVVEIMV